MKTIQTLILAGCLALLGASCTWLTPPPTFKAASAKFPQIPQGEGRIFFYRANGVGFGLPVQMNGEYVGYHWGGSFFYVDRPTGHYTVNELSFTLNEGETKYVRFTAKTTFLSKTIITTLEDEDAALQTLAKTTFNPFATNRVFNHPPGQ